MRVLMIHYRVDDRDVAEVTAAVEAALAALATAPPAGVRFEYYRVAGQGEFVGLLRLDEGVENPLPNIAAMRALQSTVAERAIGGPPMPRPLERIGS
ncbi:hypothetical protein [Sandaracinus amylolyticus]|uniref:hypothetical protein n=1 Tax=Sandaracinus amylolyticus TaxID=927083 RepID=UPI001F16702D|nr:hypothetical protein [Sandaracinus amylolyticus]UJR84947.1 Hypothetical protein I5071_70260 [Sandaracinus amylolyticus]